MGQAPAGRRSTRDRPRVDPDRALVDRTDPESTVCCLCTPYGLGGCSLAQPLASVPWTGGRGGPDAFRLPWGRPRVDPVDRRSARRLHRRSGNDPKPTRSAGGRPVIDPSPRPDRSSRSAVKPGSAQDRSGRPEIDQGSIPVDRRMGSIPDRPQVGPAQTGAIRDPDSIDPGSTGIWFRVGFAAPFSVAVKGALLAWRNL